MKLLRLLTLVFITLTSLTAFGQNYSEAELPAVVRDNFKAKHPDVFVYEWKWKKKYAAYRAEYIMNGAKYKTYYTADGKWLRTKRELKKVDLPQEVWKGFSESEYTAWEIDDIEEQSNPQYDLVYEIEVKFKDRALKQQYKQTGNKAIKRQYKASKKKTYLYFLPNGKLVDVIDYY